MDARFVRLHYQDTLVLCRNSTTSRDPPPRANQPSARFATRGNASFTIPLK
jgi:hypothetical protein